MVTGPLHINVVAAVALALRAVCEHCTVIVPALPNNMEHTQRRIEAVTAIKVCHSQSRAHLNSQDIVQVMDVSAVPRKPTALLIDTTTVMDATEQVSVTAHVCYSP